MVDQIPDWTPAHTGAGVAYIAVRLDYDADAFPSGLPTLTAQVKGKRVYDPRTGDTTYQIIPRSASAIISLTRAMACAYQKLNSMRRVLSRRLLLR